MGACLVGMGPILLLHHPTLMEKGVKSRVRRSMESRPYLLYTEVSVGARGNVEKVESLHLAVLSYTLQTCPRVTPGVC